MTIIYLASIALLILSAACVLLFLFTWWTNRRVLRALPAQGRFVEAGGVSFHVFEQGSGPSLIMIHGLAGQMRHFTYGVAQILAHRFRVVVIDRPGSGYSVRSSTMAADISSQAAAIAQLITQLGLGPSVIVGHSLGGAVALTLALEHPECVTGLALLAPLTHLPEDNRPPAAFRALMISSAGLRRAIAWTLLVPASIAQRDMVLGQVFGPDAVPEDYGIRGGGLMNLCPHQFISASLDLLAVSGSMEAIESRYAELRIPVQVLFGRGDRILNWQRNGQMLVDKIPGAKLVLTDSGHMLPVTHPELTAEFIAGAVIDMSGP